MRRRTSVGALVWVCVQAAAASALDLSVDSFSARGNGVDDDTAAIQAGLNAAVPGATVVFTPGKTYRIAGTLSGLVPRSHTRLVLHGATLRAEDQPGGKCRVFTVAGKTGITFSGG